MDQAKRYTFSGVRLQAASYPLAVPKTLVGYDRLSITKRSLTRVQDPIFQPDGFDKTYAELDSDIKNTISHRGRALAQLKEYLEGRQLFRKAADTKE
jgi:hypothetical protein